MVKRIPASSKTGVKKKRVHPPSLVDRLCEAESPVEVGVHPKGTLKRFRDEIDRNYVHIKFTRTRGGTELGIRLDRDNCDFTKADFESGTGQAHIEGLLTLDYVNLRCLANIDLDTLEGTGRLVRTDTPESAVANTGSRVH